MDAIETHPLLQAQKNKSALSAKDGAPSLSLTLTRVAQENKKQRAGGPPAV